MTAAWTGNLGAVEALLGRGASPNAKENEPGQTAHRQPRRLIPAPHGTLRAAQRTGQWPSALRPEPRQQLSERSWSSGLRRRHGMAVPESTDAAIIVPSFAWSLFSDNPLPVKLAP